MNPGDVVGQVVRIKLEDGTKVWGRVTDVQVFTGPVGAPGKMAPGLRSATMTLELEL